MVHDPLDFERKTMRIQFVHPAIVRGNNPGGSPKAELCRVESEFEIPEYTFDDAPVALVASGQSRPSDYYHLHDGKLYMPFPVGHDYGPFSAEGPLSYGLHNGNSHHIHFDPFFETVNWAAARIEDDSGLAIKVDVRRQLLKRETKIGMREVTKACLNAPMLRKWSWLSPHADQDIDHWRSIAAEKIGNIVMINGVPCVRAFEPCYSLTTAYGAPQIQVSSKRVFAKQVHVVDRDADGLETLGNGSRQRHTHYFAASDYEGAEAFAKAIGWRLLPDQKPRILIRNEATVTDDFDTLETVRHAHLLLATMKCQQNKYHVNSYLREDPNGLVGTMLTELTAREQALKGAVLSWQDQKRDVDGIRAELVAMTEHALACVLECSLRRKRQGSFFETFLHVPPENRDAAAWSINSQLEQFVIRADQAEVSLEIPMTRSLGR
jgi:hypothetical protein